MNRSILRECVIAGLEALDYFRVTEERIALLMETAAVESHCGNYDVPHRLRGSYGVFQVTESSASDTLDWLRRTDWNAWRNVMECLWDHDSDSLVDNLTHNVEFSAAVAGMIYMRMAPKADISTREQRAKAWKRFYNTELGSGSEAGYLRAAKECLGE